MDHHIVYKNPHSSLEPNSDVGSVPEVHYSVGVHTS